MNVVTKGNHELVGVPNIVPNGIIWEIKCNTCNVQLHSMQELEDHLNGKTTHDDSYDRAMKGVI